MGRSCYSSWANFQIAEVYVYIMLAEVVVL